MTMTEWAKREIEIFKDGADRYMSSCADSALKAYNLYPRTDTAVILGA